MGVEACGRSWGEKLVVISLSLSDWNVVKGQGKWVWQGMEVMEGLVFDLRAWWEVEKSMVSAGGLKKKTLGAIVYGYERRWMKEEEEEEEGGGVGWTKSTVKRKKRK